ncbi:MAG: DnaJ domain-containing protein [Saprospiraceae bacterium]|nr:DnaJ domain-containing protein [Saprospiraceae bacterium]
MNHFEFFGIPMSFTVDEAAVKRQYLLNSRKYHPDFHTLADDQAQHQALEMSTRNNEAFKVLSDPDARMQYILAEKGLLSGDGTQGALPQDFLMDMMEINEAVMELEFDFSQEQYEAAMTRIRELEEVLGTSITPLLSAWTELTDQPGQLELVRDFFYKKRYLLRTKENLSKFAPA